MLDHASEEDYHRALDGLIPLRKLVAEYIPDLSEGEDYFAMEMVLWALVAYKKLNRKRFSKGYEFKDSYGAYLSNL